MKVALCHPFGAQNFEMAPTFLENLCTPELKIEIKITDILQRD
jgi:hypothetical protein